MVVVVVMFARGRVGEETEGVVEEGFCCWAFVAASLSFQRPTRIEILPEIV